VQRCSKSRQDASRLLATSVISIFNYCKAYKETIAVEGLSFDVEPGTVLGLVGPNGAGKTTTLRSIAGIIAPTSGQITVGGFDVVSQPMHAKRECAFIPDEPRLFESLTVWEHLLFTAATYRVNDFRIVAGAI
jgi:ABC-2 type transport system ATP-binding protein